ncbi:FtsK/SpoIIIE domain-containing protein [Embleya sp. NPDC020886]|uniref:FtsK/SpoIIIE domain-containing protein n=1 Tax=Embleya sp. NPDC020886 TaxID=3363980 RepID=UPI003787399E
MVRQLLIWVLLVLVAGLVAGAPVLRRRFPVGWWYAVGFVPAAVRVLRSWRSLTIERGLTITRRPALALLGTLIVRGQPLRPIPPRIGIPRPRPGGLAVTVRMHPGQTPDAFAAAADSLAHAWHVHAVRVASPERGRVRLTALSTDPLADLSALVGPGPAEPLMCARVGRREDGQPWVIDFRAVPHWLIVGATRSGKSTLLAALVTRLAPQPVALVGIDLKGGMELGLFGPRLSALATTRREATALLDALVVEAQLRMAICRFAHARSVWELPDGKRPMPIVVLVDEVAELFLAASRADKDEAARAATALVRLAQLGAALGLHLVVAGQRVGSDLGPGATALRAQLAGRVCHRVSDPGTAEMVLGDLDPDAVDAAQAISADEPGVAVLTGVGGEWTRARSVLVSPKQAALISATHAAQTPDLPALRLALATCGGGNP